MDALRGTSRRSVPLRLPVLTVTVTVYVAPEPLTLVTDAPTTPVVVKLKSVMPTAVTASENLTLKRTLDAAVGLGSMRRLEMTMGALQSVWVWFPFASLSVAQP